MTLASIGDAGPSNVDIPPPGDTGDDLFMEHAEGALDRARDFQPDLLFVVFGYDSHIGDYGAFCFTDNAYRRFALAALARFEIGVCFVLSGGAEVDNDKTAISAVWWTSSRPERLLDEVRLAQLRRPPRRGPSCVFVKRPY